MKKAIVTFLAISIIFLGSCTKEIECDNIEEDNPILTLEMFPEHLELYSFASTTDTLILEKESVDTTPAYIDKCHPLDPLTDCYCHNSHEEYYRNDSINIDYGISVDYYLESLKTYQIGYYISASMVDFYAYIEFYQIDLQVQIDEMLHESILIDDTNFFNVLVIDGYHDNTSSTIRIIIKPNVGLVGFAVNDDLYQLIE